MLNRPVFRYFGLIVIGLSVTVTSLAQRGKSSILQYDTAARFGKVVLTDGSEAAGQIVFNDNDGIFTVFQGDDSRSFNSRSIVKAEFFDEQAGRNRLFYSLEFDDPETGRKDTEIFEVLKELSSFVVLVKVDRLRTEARKSLLLPQTSPALTDRTGRRSTQTQTIFFMNAEGNFEPYLNIVEKEIGSEFWDNHETNTRMINAGLFKEYTGPYFKTLVEYAKENALSFKRKGDIITILEEYERLSGK